VLKEKVKTFPCAEPSAAARLHFSSNLVYKVPRSGGENLRGTLPAAGEVLEPQPPPDAQPRSAAEPRTPRGPRRARCPRLQEGTPTETPVGRICWLQEPRQLWWKAARCGVPHPLALQRPPPSQRARLAASQPRGSTAAGHIAWHLLPPPSLNSEDSHKAGLKAVFLASSQIFPQAELRYGNAMPVSAGPSACPADGIRSRSCPLLAHPRPDELHPQAVRWAGGEGTGRDPSQPWSTLADISQAMGPLPQTGMPHNPPPSPPQTTSGSWGRFAVSSPSWNNSAHGGSHPDPLSQAQGWPPVPRQTSPWHPPVLTPWTAAAPGWHFLPRGWAWLCWPSPWGRSAQGRCPAGGRSRSAAPARTCARSRPLRRHPRTPREEEPGEIFNLLRGFLNFQE